MKILITGAKGQLGIELRGVLEKEMPGITTYTGKGDLDLSDAEFTRRYMERGMFTHVINCASYSAIDLAETESGLCSAVNTRGAANLANYSSEYGYKIIHISTDYVFDGTACRPYTESDKVNPTTHYGATKRKGETSLLAMAPDSVILRTGRMFSPYGENFVTKMLVKAQLEKSIDVVADQVGTLVYALDMAKAIVEILKSRQWVEGVFNYSNEGVATRYDIAKALFRIAGVTDCKLNPIPACEYPSQTDRPYYTVLDKTRIRRTYGVATPHWEESLQDCVARMRAMGAL